MDLLAGRKLVLQWVFAFVLFVFVVRLFYMQVWDASNSQKAKNISIRELTVYPSRGLIYDRNGKLILYNKAEYDIMVIPREVKAMDTMGFCNLTGIDLETFRSNLKLARKYSPVLASVFLKSFSPEQYAALQEEMYLFPGFYGQLRTVRGYNYEAAGHVLGYISEATPEQIKKDAYYRNGDYTGIGGLEQQYEKFLRGKKGVRNVLVDNRGREIGQFEHGDYDSAAVAGQNIISTLDIDLQMYGEKLMQGKTGSVVAIEPSSGEILSMISSPAYNPNLLSGRDRGKNYKVLQDDPLKPLFFRPIKASYPPGSIYKPLLALIGLQEGMIDPDASYNCPGAYFVGKLRVGCHHKGFLNNMKEAIQHSCNAYFCNYFRKVIDNNKYKTVAQGLDSWKSYLSSFSIGVKTGVDLPHEGYGYIPDSKYYNKIYKGSWNSVTVVSLGIGQGETGFTPLQMANEAAAICNRGWYYTPHLVRKIEGDTSELKKFQQKNIIPIEKKYFDLVVDGMRDVVEGGTGRIAQIPGQTVGGKTGTAQNPHGKDHSLFIAFAPIDNPKIAIAVIVENAGFGATYAAPIASLMMEKYLNDTIASSRLYLEESMFNANLNNH